MLTPIRRRPKILRTTTGLTSGQVPAFSSANNWRAIYEVALPPPLRGGDVLDVNLQLHVTNDAFRPDSTALIWGFCIHLATETGNTPNGAEIIPSARNFSIGDEAHHGLLPVTATYVVPTDVFEPRYVVTYCYFQHPSGNGSQMVTCPDNPLGMEVTWFRN